MFQGFFFAGGRSPFLTLKLLLLHFKRHLPYLADRYGEQGWWWQSPEHPETAHPFLERCWSDFRFRLKRLKKIKKKKKFSPSINNPEKLKYSRNEIDPLMREVV